MPTVTEKLEKAITNGQMRMKVRTDTKVAFVILIALFLGILALIVFKISKGQFDIAPGVIGLPAFLYGIYANPVTMKQSDLEAVAPDGTFRTFRMFYKGQELIIRHKTDEEDYFKFDDIGYQKGWLTYEDGSDLFFLTDHKITNYFLEWLMTYDLQSHPKDI